MMMILIKILIVSAFFLVTIQAKELTNKELIAQKYSNDKCLNLNENYIYINTSVKSNRLHKIINNAVILKKTYQIGTSATKEELDKIFSKKKDISNKISLNKYNAIEDKKLSQLFNNLFLNSLIAESNFIDKEIDYINLEKDLEPITKLFKKDMFFIRFNTYKNVSVVLDRNIYEFIKNYMYQDIQKFDTDNTSKTFYGSHYLQKKFIEIILIFQKRLNDNFTNKDIDDLNNKISYFLSKFISMPKKKGIDDGFNILYQILVDLVSLSDNDKEKLQSAFITKNANDNFKKERNIIFNFYKKNPLKVFVMQNKYKPPFTDGIYGYLYIHKNDVQKLQQNHQIYYLMLHELNHVIYHLSSPKNRFSQMMKNLKMLNYMDNMITIGEELVKTYDKKGIFNKDLFSAKKTWSKEKVSIKEKLKLSKQNMLNDMFGSVINKRKLNAMEELSIDLSNLNTLAFLEKKKYYSMLEQQLPYLHPRLKPLKMTLQLYMLRKNKFNQEEFDLVKAFDKIMQIWEASQDFKEDTYINLFFILKNFHHELIELKKDYRTYTFINKLYDTDILSKKLSHLLRYLYFKDALIKSSVNYMRYSIINGEL